MPNRRVEPSWDPHAPYEYDNSPHTLLSDLPADQLRSDLFTLSCPGIDRRASVGPFVLRSPEHSNRNSTGERSNNRNNRVDGSGHDNHQPHGSPHYSGDREEDRSLLATQATDNVLARPRPSDEHSAMPSAPFDHADHAQSQLGFPSALEPMPQALALAESTGSPSHRHQRRLSYAGTGTGTGMGTDESGACNCEPSPVTMSAPSAAGAAASMSSTPQRMPTVGHHVSADSQKEAGGREERKVPVESVIRPDLVSVCIEDSDRGNGKARDKTAAANMGTSTLASNINRSDTVTPSSNACENESSSNATVGKTVTYQSLDSAVAVGDVKALPEKVVDFTDTPVFTVLTPSSSATFTSNKDGCAGMKKAPHAGRPPELTITTSAGSIRPPAVVKETHRDNVAGGQNALGDFPDSDASAIGNAVDTVATATNQPQSQGTIMHALRDRARSMFLAPIQLPNQSQSPGLAHHSPANFGTTPHAPLSTLSFVSPMLVDDEVLRVPLHIPEPVRSKHKGVVYYVRQIRSSTGHATFDKHFLHVRLNDTVTFEWFDASQHVFETSATYDCVVPGGLSSTTQLPEPTNSATGKKPSILVPKSHDESVGKVTFSVKFVTPGDYYFVCSKNKRRMRLHVQVISDRVHYLSRGLVTLVAALFLAIVIVVVVLVLAYWLQKRDLFLSRDDAVSEEQYRGFKKLQNIVTLKIFPWLATGILVVLAVIVLAVSIGIQQRYWPKRQGSWHRGVETKWRRILGIGTTAFCVINVVLLFVVYGLQLRVTDGVYNFAAQLGSSITSTINAYNTALFQVDWLVNEAEDLFPNVSLPVDDIVSTIRLIDGILNDTKRWTSMGEDAVQGAFRALPILLFLTLQLGLFAASMAIGVIVLRYPRHASAVAWMLAACVGVYACAVGVVWAVAELMSMIYDSAVTFQDGPGDFHNRLGLANDSVVAQLFGSCSVWDADVEFVVDFVQGVMEQINASLTPDQQVEFSMIFGFVNDVIPIGLDALVNYTSYIQANLNALMQIVTNDGDAVNSFFNMDIFPFLQVFFSVLDTLNGLVNCRILREIVVNAIPVLRSQVQSYNTALLVFFYILFAMSVLTLLFAAGSAYALRNPRRIWYEPRTGRWFRLRYAYKIHHQMLAKSAAVKGKKGCWRDDLQRRVRPIMRQLLTVKIVCYTASVLMFFNAILLVLFNDVARTISSAPMLRALSYLGCAQLIFLLGSATFRQVWMRWILHGSALAITLGCLGVSIAQAIVGFIKFGGCIGDLPTTGGHVVGANVYYEKCSVSYTGHELEMAVYATVIGLNSITLTVTLIMLAVNERKLKASFERRHYVGVLTPIEKRCPLLACLFRDMLNVTRLYIYFFILIVVVFLVVFAVLDVGDFNIVGIQAPPVTIDGDIAQVINPDVGCNGNPNYCSLRVNQYIWACTHNAHSSLEDGFVAANHYFNITRQLTAGIRSFMIDLWYDTINVTESDAQDVYLCHAICLAGRRPFRQIAKEYTNFLERYPKQVIMLILEQYVNNTDVARIMHETGLDRYAWYSDQVPPNRNPDYVWPTFQELIDKDQRVMVFNDIRATSALALGRPEWLYYGFNFLYENHFGTEDVSQWRCTITRGWCTRGLEDINQSNPHSSSSSSATSSMACEEEPSENGPNTSVCTPEATRDPLYWVKWAKDITNCTDDEGPWREGSDDYGIWAKGGLPAVVSSKMSIVNHMITNSIGSPVQASRANIPASIRLTAFNCSTYWNQVPNVYAFDFWSIANPLATVEGMNQNLVRYGRRYNFRDAWGMMLMGDNDFTIENSWQALADVR